ncbi:MAG: cation:proton antiporter, partial [Chloroflexota bacterium]
MFTIPAPVLYFASFVIVAVAAREIGHFLGRFKLPHITGYLLAGLIIGPFVLNLIPSEAIDGLRFVDEISLAVIAFVAGSELYLKELRSRMRPILL